MIKNTRSIGWFLVGALIASMIGGALGSIINPLPYIFQNGTTADATQVNADFAEIVNDVNTNAVPLSTAALVPSGAVMAFNLAACPTGWVLSDGTSGTADLRGYFIRGLDTGGSVDPGRTLGTFEGDIFQDHSHSLTAYTGANCCGSGSGFAFTGTFGSSTGTANSGNRGSETRPKNVALRYCQKQ